MNNRNDKNDKKSLWTRLLEHGTLLGIAAVITAMCGGIAIVGKELIPIFRPTPAPSVPPTAPLVSETPASPEPTLPTHTPTPTATPTHTPTPVVPTPTCVRGIDSQLSSAWDRSRLGCPASAARIIWAAWEPFERGYMFWRSDTNRVIVFFDDRTWTEFLQQWTEGAPIPSRGSPPPGLLAPSRGFGYIWGIQDDVANRIGWALDQEKGFCANIQLLERGFVFRSSTVTSCQDELYNWATHPSFTTLLFAVHDDDTWQQW